MNVNVSRQMVNLKGHPIQIGERICPECKRPIEAVVLTLRDVLINSVTSEVEEDKRIDGGIKFKRFKLAQRINDHEDVSLSAEEVTLLKERVAKFYTALIVGQVWEVLDPQPEEGMTPAK